MDDLSLASEGVDLFPVPYITEGDRVTVRVVPSLPDSVPADSVTVTLAIDNIVIAEGVLADSVDLGRRSGRIFPWTWQPPAAGTYTLTVHVDPYDQVLAGDENPNNNLVHLPITVNSAVPLGNGQWNNLTTAFANIHFVTGTAADRDQAELIGDVDAAVQRAAETLQTVPERKLEVYFIDRVLGQGGYASGVTVASYPDRNYAGGDLDALLAHEAIHVLDDALVQGAQYSILTEGLAVWGTGGHYKPENLDERAAALLIETDDYISLEALANNFYPAQHEIGYLEAGAFVKYLVDLYGWNRFSQFYGTLPEPKRGDTVAETLSKATKDAFGKKLSQLESDWHRHLRNQPPSMEAQDLELTIRFYDVMRAYQQKYDQTAYFLFAWLPSAPAARDGEQTAVFTRHPQEEVNIVYETMLVAADQALREGNGTRTNTLLNSIELSLDLGEFRDPLAASYESVVRAVLAEQYEPQQILFEGPTATVYAIPQGGLTVETLSFTLDSNLWTLTN